MKLKNKNYEEFFVDGTGFRIPFKKTQLFVISTCTDDTKPIPIFFALSNDFTTKNYIFILNYFNQKILSLKSKIIHCDFEMALLQAVLKFTKNLKVCFFHFAQIIVKNGRKMKKINDIINEDDIIITKSCRKIFYFILQSSIFLHKDNIAHHLNFLKILAFGKKIEFKLLKYIAENFLEGKFGYIFFQSFDRHNTNNISESFNSRLERFSYKNKPTIKILLDFLIFETKRNNRNLQTNWEIDEIMTKKNLLYEYVTIPKDTYENYEKGLYECLRNIDINYVQTYIQNEEEDETLNMEFEDITDEDINDEDIKEDFLN